MPPFTYKDPDGSYGGWEYHVVASLAKNMNFSLDINPPPNGELWGENKNGTFTGTVVANSTCSGLKPSISPLNVAQNVNPGTVLETACPEDSKTPPTC